MSHELRTPLTAITAVTEVLEEELDSEAGGIDPMIEPAVRLVVSETRRLNILVENLMEVTRSRAPPGWSWTTSTSPTRSPPASTPAPGWTRWNWTPIAASTPASTRAAWT